MVVARDGGAAADDGGRKISIIFAPETDEISLIAEAISEAEDSIHLMVFVFSLGELADVILEKMNDPEFAVRGVFEDRNSKASWSQLPTLHCAGAEMRQDGNPFVLHHKVMIIDEDTVITGSFNFSNNAAQSNDENIVILRDSVITRLYLDEWERIWNSAENFDRTMSSAPNRRLERPGADAVAISWAGVQSRSAPPDPAAPPCNTSVLNPAWGKVISAPACGRGIGARALPGRAKDVHSSLERAASIASRMTLYFRDLSFSM